MAEAYSAVRPLPSLSLSSEIDFSNPKIQARITQKGFALFIPKPRFMLRTAYRNLRHAYGRVRSSTFPLPVSAAIGGVMAAVFFAGSYNPHTGLFLGNFIYLAGETRFTNAIERVEKRIPIVRSEARRVHMSVAAFSISVFVLVSVSTIHRFFTRLLLQYMGWMHEPRGKTSIATKIWAALLKYMCVGKRTHSTLAMQSALPKFPLRSIEETTAAFVECQRPLLTKEELMQLERDRDQFIKNEGKKLQQYLHMKSWLVNNYQSDWWLRFVYLTSRDSLMINSNFYGCSLIGQPPTSRQASRAAYLAYQLMKVKLEVDREQLEPMLINGFVPLCMDQYTRAFSLTREPHEGEDKLVKYEHSESRHIVIIHAGRYYKMQCFSEVSGRLLLPSQFEAAIDGILADADPATEVEQKLWALTALDRNKWATIRNDFFVQQVVNKLTLSTIERAMFIVCLDSVSPDIDNLSQQGNQWIHGAGNARWFDKSASLLVTPNGIAAINVEHSWGDAPTFAHLWEVSLAREVNDQPYAADGRLKSNTELAHLLQRGKARLYNAERLPFVLKPQLCAEVREAARSAEKQISDLHLVVHQFSSFGKGQISKIAQCSPDAFIQMSFQLAYFRKYGTFVNTYESAMLRFYLEGRTETIRSVSAESCEWVRAMVGRTLSKSELAAALKKACEKHHETSVAAMTANGIDRHLFALYVVSVGTRTESPFIKWWKRCKWKLSTSQVPTNQAKDWKVKNPSDIYPPSPNGGFGPVAEDGYGVSYTTGPSNSIFFHISSKHSCPVTNSEEMRKEICQALEDMMALFR